MEEDKACIPDALLAVAKDRRYIDTLESLISRTLSPYFVTDNTDAVAAMQPEISLFSRALYAVILIKEGSSIGFGHLGLGYPQHSARSRVFAILYTLSFYIIERAGRNGWSELGKIRSPFSSSRQLGSMNAVQREQLRGEDRRRIYEEMRQRMLRGSTGTNNDDDGRVQAISARNGNVYNQEAVTDESPITRIALKILRGMSTAFKMKSPIPHELGVNNTVGNEGDGQNISPQIDRLVGLFKWLMRINVALFYANGKYPSILHRLCGLQIGRGDMKNINIAAQRPAYNAIGVMIIGQGIVKLAQAIVEVSVDAWYSRMQSRSVRSVSSKIEAMVPSYETSSKNEHLMAINTSLNATATCGICMNERKHSAASKGCGHVFCWHCIQHWIATVRHECPFCRAPTRPQDVVLLYNYAPE